MTGIEVLEFAGTLVTEVQVPSRQPRHLKSWVRFSRGIEQCARQFVPKDIEHQNSGFWSRAFAAVVEVRVTASADVR